MTPRHASEGAPLPPPGRSRWTSFVAEPDGAKRIRGLHEEGNPKHRVRVEHDRATLFVHLSGEDGGDWLCLTVDRATREWAVGSGPTQKQASVGAWAGLYAAPAPGGDPRISTVTLNAPDPPALARFYAALLHGTITTDEPGWAVVRPPYGVSVACALEEDYVAPVWPGVPGEPQMQVHLEVHVDDLSAGVDHALACGATLAAVQPQDDVRVCLDPVGHPFCLWIG